MLILLFNRFADLLNTDMTRWRAVRTVQCVKSEKRSSDFLTAYLRLRTVSKAWRGDKGALQRSCVGLEGRDEGKVAIVRRHVKPIADNKLVGQLYPAVIEGNVDKAAIGAVKEHGDPQ